MTRTWLLLLLVMTPTAAQDIEVARLQAPGPVVRHFLADLDGDGRHDLVALCTGAGPVVFLQRGPPLGFHAPHVVETPVGTAGLLVADVDPDGGRELVAATSEAVFAVGFQEGRVGKPQLLAHLDLIFAEGHQGLPAFLGWARDADGDRRDDLLLPGLSEDLLLLQGKGTWRGPLPVRTPQRTERLRHPMGLLALRTTRPRVAFHPVKEAGRPQPVWFDARGLHVLEDGAKRGYGPGSRLLVPLEAEASPSGQVLERVSLELLELDGDGLHDLLVARTRADPRSLTLEQRIEVLLFLSRAQDAGKGRPTQVLLLPGVLSKGPRLRDLDGDGRLDLIVSLYGADLKAHLSRLLISSVRMTWHVYLGREGPTPFAHSPAISLHARVPLEQFAAWDLRHRVLLQGDWDGDGRCDLLRAAPDDGLDGITLRAHRLVFEDGRGTAMPPPILERHVEAPVQAMHGLDLGQGLPGLLVVGGDRLTVVAPARKH